MSDLERSLFYLLDIGGSIHQFNKESEMKMGLSLVQWCLLRHLIDMPSASPQTLATAVGVHPSTLTQTIKRLERKKYIFVADDTKDSRKKIISITRLGKNTLDSVSYKMNNWLKEIHNISEDLHRVSSSLQSGVLKEL